MVKSPVQFLENSFAFLDKSIALNFFLLLNSMIAIGYCPIQHQNMRTVLKPDRFVLQRTRIISVTEPFKGISLFSLLSEYSERALNCQEICKWHQLVIQTQVWRLLRQESINKKQ